MAQKGNVFLIGPGFIGLEVLHRLLEASYPVTVLVRRPEAAAEIEKAGAKTVKGTLDDQAVIEEQTSASDIVVHTATADHLPSVQAVIQGVKKRAAAGKSTVYIHTSGTSQLSDDSEGAFKGDKVFSDETAADIDALPDSASHREIDLAIVRARAELGTKAKLVIILPPLIFGVGSTSNRLSIQLPTMARFALKHGYAAHVGDGLSIWSHVHVKDLVRGYLLLLDWLQQTSAERILENPYFFAENSTELSWGECAAEIGRVFHKAGRIEDPKPRPVPKELYGDLFGMYTAWVVGSNSRSRAKRLREIGWLPREKGTIESLREDELPILLEEKGDFAGYAGVAASGSG